MPLWTEPAVLARVAPGTRDALTVVAYDDSIDFDREGWERISAGLANLNGWEYVPEVLIEDRYQRAQTVAMLDTVDLARKLLPVANGAKVQLVDSAGQAVQTVDTVPENNNARLRAERLVEEITRLLTRNMRTGPSVA